MFRYAGDPMVRSGLPEPIGGRFSIIAEALLALPQRHLGPFAVLDVDARSIPFDDISDLVAKRYVMDQVPAVHSTSPPHPSFIVERYPRRYRGAPRVHIPCAIFGVV